MSDPESDRLMVSLFVMIIMFLVLAFFSISTVLKNIDLKLAMDDIMTCFDIWKHSREKPLWEIEKKYLTKDEQKRESVFAKECADSHFIMSMETLRKEVKS